MARIFLRMGPLLLAIAIGGCATTESVEPREAAATSVAELHESLVTVRGQIRETLGSLNALTSATPTELEEAFQQYAADVDRVSEGAEQVEEISGEMRAHRDEWLAAWQESHAGVENPELRAVSERRRIEVLERWRSVDQSLTSAREAFRPFIANVRDVQQVVDNDLTPEGVSIVARTEAVQNANREGTRAARALGIAIAELEALQRRQPEDEIIGQRDTGD
jgi:hypothetical protein